MNWKILLACSFIFFFGCSKEDDTVDKKRSATLLTQQEWILTGAGFDDNDNGVLDPNENAIQECQKDNSYVFREAGTGSALDNAIPCGNPVNSNFQWSFVENATRLKIAGENSFIYRLSEEELILGPELPGLAVRFILTYRH